jgi:hypothetical protein
MGILTTGTAKVIAGVVLTGAVAGGIVIATSNSGNSNNKPAVTQVDSSKTSFKIIGKWVNTDDSTVKNVFTADSVTQISDGQPPETLKYNWVNEQEIEIIYNNKGDKAKAKVTIDGDSLTLSVNGKDIKHIREGAYNANPLTTETKEDVPLTPEAKLEAYKAKFLGRWDHSYTILEITKDTAKFYYKGKLTPFETDTYKLLDEHTLDLTTIYPLPEKKPKSNIIKISGNGDKISWVVSHENGSSSTFFFYR